MGDPVFIECSLRLLTNGKMRDWYETVNIGRTINL